MVPPVPSRLRLAEVIARRPRGNLLIGWALALVFALVVTPIVLAERWLVDARVVAGEPATVTVRVRAFDGYDDGSLAARGGAVVVARGERATPEQAALADAAQRNAPRGLAGFGAYAAVLFLLAAGVTHHLRRSNAGRLLRVQLVMLGTVAAGAALTKGLLLLWPVSVLAVPVALGAVVPTLAFDRTVGLAGGVLAAVVMSLLVPFDVGVSTVLVVQAVAAAIVIPERARPRWPVALAAGAVGMAGALLTYAAFSYLSLGFVPMSELSNLASSSWLAAGIGGIMAGLLAMPFLSLFQVACGEITQGTLVALEDLSHPLLRQISEKAPGTWQHSLAMANMAEVAANSIGASGRLVRVGAYFHDLGKSLQPPYFIENLAAGEPSPHDRLAPEVSCDAIFAHVTEGIALARRQKLPERIIDFMHMHHGDGVLEYFWAKCQELGNPRKLTIEDFRYPGVPPQSRETAILAICDAVEAASRTLKRPDERSIENLVQRIVYGKLHLGQLDESGLSMGDLRRINNSLRETIKHAHHGRIEYPWQREAAAEAAAAQAAGTGPTVVARAPTATQRLMQEPRLDSLDVPRPLEWEDTGRPRLAATPPSGISAQVLALGDVGAAPTMPMTTPAGGIPKLLPGPAAPDPVAAVAAESIAAPVAAPVAAPIAAPVPVEPPPIAPAVVVPSRAAATTLPVYPWDQVPLPDPPPMPDAIATVGLRAPEPAAVAVPDGEVVLLTPEMHAPHALPEPTPGLAPPSLTGPMAVVAPSESGSMAVAPIAMHPTTTGPIAMPPPSGTSSWASTLAARLDTMLDEADDDAFGAEPTKKSPPPPPPRRRPTHEVDVDDVEATIELNPHARAEPSGLIVGPPPATRPSRPVTQGNDHGYDGDDGPTVVRKPASSMLPPRARNKPE